THLLFNFRDSMFECVGRDFRFTLHPANEPVNRERRPRPARTPAHPGRNRGAPEEVRQLNFGVSSRTLAQPRWATPDVARKALENRFGQPLLTVPVYRS